MADPLSFLWSYIPRSLFFNPNDEDWISPSGKSSPTPSDDSCGSFETIDDTDDFIEEASEELLTPWPIVEKPKSGLVNTIFMPYHKSLELPMLAISVSNVFLQIVSDIRDLVLSYDSDTVSGEVKLGIVSVLSLGSAIGYTICTTKEALIKLVCGLVLAAATIVFAVIASLFSDDDSSESMVVLPIRIGIGLTIILLGGALQCFAQVGTGFLGAHEMLTNQDRNMPNVSTLTNRATFGLQNLLIADVISDLMEDVRASIVTNR